MRFHASVAALVARVTNPARRGAVAHRSGVPGRATPTACAAVLLLSGIPGSAHSAPPTCADVRKSIEKRLHDAGVRHPPLKIVPKNLSAGYRVVGTCEGGTQRIVHDTEPAPSRDDAAKATDKPRSASAVP